MSLPMKDLVLLDIDLLQIRSAILRWKKNEELAHQFDVDRLKDHFEYWEKFVQQEWQGWDESEYDHDLGCRYWIQVAIEYSSVETKMALEKLVMPIDNQFQVKMQPLPNPKLVDYGILHHHPYFWEIDTIFC